MARSFQLWGASVPAPTTDHLCPSVTPNGPCSDYTSQGDYEMAGYNAADYSELDYTASALVINWDLSDAVSIKSITGYSLTETKVALDYDGTPGRFFSGVGPKNDTEALSEELQLRLNLLNDRLQWTSGLFYYDQDLETLTAFAFGARHACRSERDW